MNIDLRRASLADVSALHALVESAYRGDTARQGWTHEADLLGGQRTDLAALAETLADPDTEILVAEVAGELVACVQVTKAREGVGLLGMLSVAPPLQGGGIGRQLIAAAEELARTAFAAHTMEMTVIHQRTELIAYYQRRGYSLTGARKPFPRHDRRFGVPKTDDLEFVVLEKAL
jgi:GNAT superfamily N-acetyltransferase